MENMGLYTAWCSPPHNNHQAHQHNVEPKQSSKHGQVIDTPILEWLPLMIFMKTNYRHLTTSGDDHDGINYIKNSEVSIEDLDLEDYKLEDVNKQIVKLMIPSFEPPEHMRALNLDF